MLGILKENPSISAKELVMKVYQINPKTANMLTRISKMFDIKDDPERHGKYLIFMLMAEYYSAKIVELKNALENVNEDKDISKIYKKIYEFQLKVVDFKKKSKEVL